MSDNTSSPPASGITNESIGLLLSKFEEQNDLIRQLTDRIAQLESRSSGPPSIASPIPVPPPDEAWAAFFKAHAESLASQSIPSSPSPSVSLSRDPSAFSPPPFRYPYGPYPGYYPPMQGYPHWPPPNQPARSGQNSDNTSISNVNGASATDGRGAHAAPNWGEATSNNVTNSVNESNHSSYSRGAGSRAIPCRFGDRCNRPDCRFEHSSETNPHIRHNDTPNSTYSPNRPNSDAAPSPRNASQQSGASTKSKPECNYGENCTRKKCSFTHPQGRKAPSHTPNPTVDQNPSAGATTSGTDQGWGASTSDNNAWDEKGPTKVEPSNEWEQWEVKPSNDWGTPSNNDWGASSAGNWGVSATNEWGTPSNATSMNPASRSENKSKKGPTGKKPDANKANPDQTRPATPPPISAEPAATNDTHKSAADPSTDTNILSLTEDPSVADAVVDSLPTPALEPERTSNSLSSPSESDNSQTPFAWGDEPLNSVEANEQTPEEPVALDAIAPSSMYGSWGPVESSGWGSGDLGATGAWGVETLVVPTNKAKSGAKGKGKQKETNQTMPVNDSWHDNANDFIAEPDSVSATAEGSQIVEPQPTPMPQGVPEEEIPDWLLGGEEDPYAALGMSRPTTPKPSTSNSKLPPPPPPPPHRPRISEMNGANFPPPKPDSNRQPPKTSVASGPTIRPRRTAWTIVSSGEQSTPKDQGGGKQSNRRHYNRKQNGKGSK